MPFVIATTIILLLALGLIGFLILYQRRLIRHQEHLRQLQETRQRQLLEAALEAQEAERRRLARDLHDEVGTMLALAKMQAGQWVNASSEDAATDGSLAIQKLKVKLDEVMSSVRRISHDLMPVVLNKYGLVQGIESLRRSLPVDSNLHVKFECNEPARRVAQRLELALYRILQELLANTIKHAAATEIYIRLHFEADKLMLTYTDNGKGFDYQNLLDNAYAGLGLTNLQSRIALLNGTLDFSSEKGSGVTFVASIPTDNN
ncbi:sensor histidine kinase [Pontibacter beigongshangensis]|uniref:sensor histidine kinase n=1 Tax=Pontibacter beigongshangensis TaxID=2574733 RepID=UPI001888CFE8|nr:sensor histidine kinase [Pontibacter beigongshangensis]